MLVVYSQIGKRKYGENEQSEKSTVVKFFIAMNHTPWTVVKSARAVRNVVKFSPGRSGRPGDHMTHHVTGRPDFTKANCYFVSPAVVDIVEWETVRRDTVAGFMPWSPCCGTHLST